MKLTRLTNACLAMIIACTGVSTAPVAAAAVETPGWLTCPNALTLDLRPDPERDPARVREIAPRAGANTSAELYNHARYARLAYEVYEAFDAGQDPRGAFTSSTLQLVTLIYGDPGPNTERGPRPPGRTRTLYGFVADERATGRRYVVFRGTQQPAEWVRNAQAGQRPYPSGTSARNAAAHVHAGFLQIFDSLQLDAGAGATSFSPALRNLVAGRETIFVGHSLGSALATLAGVEASRRSPQSAARLRIVTLASPRVGDAGFAALARAVGRIDRVCNLVDIVTAVPPSTPQLNYVHVGTPYRVSSFDWPALANNLDRAGDQILCWHGDQSYAFMLQPAQAPREPEGCFAGVQ
jgi:Lipase (class 3)